MGQLDRCPVLVVEDNASTNEALTILLSMCGYFAISANNGHEALTMLRAGLRPAVIVLDLMMPFVDGWEVLRETAADPTLERIPVVVYSSAGRERIPVGVAAYVPKVSDPDVLLDAINNLARPPLASEE